MTRSDLHEILIEAAENVGVHIHLGLSWKSFEQETDTVTVTYTDGSTGTYDLVVAADGIRSGVRRHLFGRRFDPVDTGYACWRMAVLRPKHLTHSEYFNGETVKATVIHLSQDLMYLLVVEQVRPGEEPDRGRMPEQLRNRLTGFGGLIGEIRDSIDADSDIHWAPLQEVQLPAPWYRGRIVISGDAAHAVLPHLAQGAGMAMEDALVLADELDKHPAVPTALEAFMARREPRVKFVLDHAHQILLNEMESDLARNAEFAAGLGAPQSEITRVLSAPA
jgi:2-polyprenyl-6-methoxyphenol hydroxylase-like FAD-dependent oxidoreductase